MSDLIERALITRIEHLERAAQELAAQLTPIWDIVFPDRRGERFDPPAIIAELRRRGIGDREKTNGEK